MDRFGDPPPDVTKLKPILLKSAHPQHPWSMGPTDALPTQVDKDNESNTGVKTECSKF